ncbi:MAG: SDR family oxidoreductase [Alphaproteobacteria bacterium]|nr:SDR family oxidoreductase [Alphaproteobacteria bacterium]
MDFNLNEKVALVTGGSRGIGKAIALALSEQGVSIALCGRTLETLDEAAEAIRANGVKAWPIQADVSRLDDVRGFVTKAAAAAGRVDILVNNAVTSLSAPFDEQTDENWRYHVDVKLMAYIRCAREVLPHMQQQGWGRIVNIGGMTARITAPLRMTNGIVNAGVANFTKQFAGYAGPHNVTVNCVHPGYTMTERMMAGFQRRARDADVSVEKITEESVAEIPMGRLIQPEDIASAAMFFCSPLADVITGQCIAVDGGSGTAVTY